MPTSTAEEIEVFAKLRKLIELAPKLQSQSQAVPTAAATQLPIASPPGITQTSSSVPASSVPKPEPTARLYPEITLPPSAAELPSLPQTASQSDPMPNPESAPMPDPVPEPISTVARCTAACNQARADALARSQPRYIVNEAGERAFRNAMPPLLGTENIREFIACVAHGMLIGVIENKDATKLLYAAQVAFSAQTRTEPKHAKSAAKVTGNN